MKTLQEQFYENALQGKEFTLAVENGETLHYVSTQNRMVNFIFSISFSAFGIIIHLPYPIISLQSDSFP